MKTLDEIAGRAHGSVLYGIGVGPGDVRYVTLRAAGLIRSVDVLAYFAKKDHPGTARTIVKDLVLENQAELKLDYPLTTELPVDHPDYQQQIKTFYEHATQTIAGHLDDGRSVGVIAEGDPFFYGSFMHLWRRLCESHTVEVVPGVTGMSGCWTRANAPITWGDDTLAVLPGTLPEADLTDRLKNSNASVIMKVGRNLAKVRRAVKNAGLTDRAIYVERGTMDGEKIVAMRDLDRDTGPYFAMVLIPGEGRRI